MSTSYAVAFDGDRFLMVWNPRRGGWEMPGGHAEEGETPAMTAAREFEEEAGLRIEVVAVRDLGYCHVCAARIAGSTGEPHEMRTGLFSEIPEVLAFSREEYEDVVPWAREQVLKSPGKPPGTVITAPGDSVPMDGTGNEGTERPQETAETVEETPAE